MEQDPEVSGSGNQYDYGFRIYNPRIAKFLSVDPLSPDYPWYTPYQFAGNKPIWAIDLDGLEEKFSTTNEQNNGQTKLGISVYMLVVPESESYVRAEAGEWQFFQGQNIKMTNDQFFQQYGSKAVPFNVVIQSHGDAVHGFKLYQNDKQEMIAIDPYEISRYNIIKGKSEEIRNKEFSKAKGNDMFTGAKPSLSKAEFYYLQELEKIVSRIPEGGSCFIGGCNSGNATTVGEVAKMNPKINIYMNFDWTSGFRFGNMYRIINHDQYKIESDGSVVTTEKQKNGMIRYNPENQSIKAFPKGRLFLYNSGSEEAIMRFDPGPDEDKNK